jgi:UDPglucose 6-dehydrogenase
MAFSDVNGVLSNMHKQLIETNVTVVQDAYVAANEAHAIAVLTEWDEFKQVDTKRVFDGMRRPAFVFDGRNILDRSKLTLQGFEVHCIGRS